MPEAAHVFGPEHYRSPPALCDRHAPHRPPPRLVHRLRALPRGPGVRRTALDEPLRTEITRIFGAFTERESGAIQAEGWFRHVHLDAERAVRVLRRFPDGHGTAEPGRSEVFNRLELVGAVLSGARQPRSPNKGLAPSLLPDGVEIHLTRKDGMWSGSCEGSDIRVDATGKGLTGVVGDLAKEWVRSYRARDSIRLERDRRRDAETL